MNIEVKNSIKPIDYNDAIEELEKRVEEVHLGKKDELLWILEHNTVYTAGTSASDIDLLDKTQKVIKTNRGGKLTIHSPGQKVVYFVLNLNNREKDIRKLMNKIEICIIKILNDFEIKSYADRKNVGIWVKKNNKTKKVAAIGIRVKKWVAYHGFSLNINNDLDSYKNIIPCGIKDKGVTNLKLIKNQSYINIDKEIISNFVKNLKTITF